MIDRLVIWSLRRLQPVLLSLALGGAAALTLAWGVESARWVNDSSALTTCILGGALMGALVAQSRWRAGWAWLYLLVMWAALMGQLLGRVLPPLPALGGMYWLDALDWMNLRLWSLTERVGGWAALAAAGERVDDTGLFICVAGLLGWLACAWMSWSIVRRQRALDGLLPMGVLLGVSGFLRKDDLGPLWVFLILAVLLAGKSAHSQKYIEWKTRQVDYPDELGLEWGTGIALIGLVVLLLARLAPVLGSPEGWIELRKLWQPARAQVEQAAEKLFAGVNPPTLKDEDQQPVVQAPDMGRIGAPLIRGDRTLFWVKVSDPAPPPPESGPSAASVDVPRHYWRSGVYTAYTGSGWVNAEPQGAVAPPPAGAEAPPGRYALEQDFEMVGLHGDTLFAVNQPAKVSEGVRLGAAGPDATPLVQGGVQRYQVTSWAPWLTANQLRVDTGPVAAEILSVYTALPASVPQRVRELARRVVGDAKTVYEMAMRIQSYLRINYTYDLDVDAPPPGRDAADYFLFEAPGGFCSYYATAMTVMLRAVGVPARVATGYATGDFDYSRQAYQVTGNSSHAWVEVYFPTYGWMEFEPTAAFDTFGYREEVGAGALPAVPEQTPLKPPAPADQAISAALLLMALAALLGLAFALPGLLRTRGGGKDVALLEATRLYADVQRGLTFSGAQLSSGVTTGEVRQAAAAAASPALGAAVDEAAAVYEQAVYSPTPPGVERVMAARRAWASTWWVRLRLWAHRGRTKA